MDGRLIRPLGDLAPIRFGGVLMPGRGSWTKTETNLDIVANVVSGVVVVGYRRIGVLKSIGFTPAQIAANYIVQTGMPALAGGWQPVQSWGTGG